MNIVHFIWLPSSTPYGNLLLKGMNIVRRIDRVNLKIGQVFTSYVHPSKEDVNNPQTDLLEHQFHEEQVVYWLRKTADELISLAYVIDEWSRTGKWPVSVRIDSPAALLDSLLNSLRKRAARFFTLGEKRRGRAVRHAP